MNWEPEHGRCNAPGIVGNMHCTKWVGHDGGHESDQIHMSLEHGVGPYTWAYLPRPRQPGGTVTAQ